MSRYRRVNIDGKSITETRLAAADLKPGTFVTINGADKFAQATAIVGRMYVINPSYHEGLTITEAAPSGNSAIGEYVEEGRELAILCAPGTYKKDTPITVNGSGQGAVGVDGTDAIVGFSQDEFTIAASTTEFIRVRMRATQKPGAAV